ILFLLLLLLLGFGPFREFLVNPSWKAAQGLQTVGFGEGLHVHIKELPVSYAKTQDIIARLWDQLQPKLMVHLGVSRGLRGLVLEQTGRNGGYSGCCVTGGPERLDSLVDMRTLCRQCKQRGMDIVYSRDAGRYLCDFAYYCSLYRGQRRAALIHVPPQGPSGPRRLCSPLKALLLLTHTNKTLFIYTHAFQSRDFFVMAAILEPSG
uniref:Pyroglutamyl-peptidase I like n=1 Tax=Neogobius melanostomus TaxID=47308 RepID=A0A8C6UKQ5_9GOBI